MSLKNLNIDDSWTLFLDRDGVINLKKEGDYIRKWEEFNFLPEALDALKALASKFKRIVIVTNQQGIGKGIFIHEALADTHKNMIQKIKEAGGRIDKIYYCPNLASENHPDRKPDCGMAYKAQDDFPEIDFKKSIIVGDSITDMEFGRKAGMITVFISENKNLVKENKTLIDYSFESLFEFSKEIEN